MAARSASRYASRASAGLNGSSRLAASSSSRAASAPRVRAKVICARSRARRARCELVELRRVGGRQELERRLGRGRVELGLRGGQRPRGAAGRVGGELDRPRQERGRGGDAAACPGTLGRALQLGGQLLVGSHRRVCPVPGAAIGIRVADRSPRPARGGPPGARAPSPPGRPPSAPADAGSARGPRTSIKPGRLRRRRRVGAETELIGRAPEQVDVADRLGRRQRAAAAWSASGSDASRRTKLCSMRVLSGRTSGSPNPPASSAAVNPRGSSRSASGLPRVSATIRSRTRSSSRPGMSRSRAARAHRRRPARGSTSSGSPARSAGVAGLAHREDQRDRLGHQAAGDEPEASAPRRDPAIARRRRRTRAGGPAPTSESRPSTARPTRKRSGGGPALQPEHRARAPRAAGPGRRSSRSRNGAHS